MLILYKLYIYTHTHTGSFSLKAKKLQYTYILCMYIYVINIENLTLKLEQSVWLTPYFSMSISGWAHMLLTHYNSWEGKWRIVFTLGNLCPLLTLLIPFPGSFWLPLILVYAELPDSCLLDSLSTSPRILPSLRIKVPTHLQFMCPALYQSP